MQILCRGFLEMGVYSREVGKAQLFPGHPVYRDGKGKGAPLIRESCQNNFSIG